MSVCKHWLPSSWRRPLSPESLSVLSGSAGCRELSFPTRLCHTWHWFRRLHSVMLTCSHTLSSTSISRNLYIESSLSFSCYFLVVCQIGAFLSCLSPFWP